MKSLMEKLEHLLELGGIKKDIALLVISGIAVVLSLLGVRPFPLTWPGSPSSCAASPSFWRPSSAWSPPLTSRRTCWSPWR